MIPQPHGPLYAILPFDIYDGVSQKWDQRFQKMKQNHLICIVRIHGGALYQKARKALLALQVQPSQAQIQDHLAPLSPHDLYGQPHLWRGNLGREINLTTHYKRHLWGSRPHTPEAASMVIFEAQGITRRIFSHGVEGPWSFTYPGSLLPFYLLNKPLRGSHTMAPKS